MPEKKPSWKDCKGCRSFFKIIIDDKVYPKCRSIGISKIYYKIVSTGVCPCITCLVKTQCYDGCPDFIKMAGKFDLIIPEPSTPQVEEYYKGGVYNFKSNQHHKLKNITKVV